MKLDIFLKQLNNIADNYKTLYIMGCFGAPMNTKNKKRYSDNNAYNRKPTRTKMIMGASDDTFGFDCVGLIKGILWGWDGNLSKTYGGATYCSNGVKDVGANGMINLCNKVSADFKNIQCGEAVWMDGHIGIYIGDGIVVESSPKWKNGVQKTYLGNIAKYKKGNYRIWTKHGFLPYVEYSTAKVEKTEVVATKNENTYTVQKGDTLWGIAKKLLKSGSKYVDIMKLNNLKTNTLKVGQVLKIPK